MGNPSHAVKHAAMGYRLVLLSLSRNNGVEADKTRNRLGAEGWELVQIYMLRQSPDDGTEFRDEQDVTQTPKPYSGKVKIERSVIS